MAGCKNEETLPPLTPVNAIGPSLTRANKRHRGAEDGSRRRSRSPPTSPTRKTRQMPKRRRVAGHKEPGEREQDEQLWSPPLSYKEWLQQHGRAGYEKWLREDRFPSPPPLPWAPRPSSQGFEPQTHQNEDHQRQGHRAYGHHGHDPSTTSPPSPPPKLQRFSLLKTLAERVDKSCTKHIVPGAARWPMRNGLLLGRR
ncbi:hypothetical protein MMC14_002316 [Varicellaria rhodocarpa]|nr:hypothetical protein [Varicellaria rhodocarpa]